MSWSSGKGRFWGASDPRYWFPLDVHRGRKPLCWSSTWAAGCGPASPLRTPAKVIELLKAKVKA